MATKKEAAAIEKKAKNAAEETKQEDLKETSEELKQSIMEVEEDGLDDIEAIEETSEDSPAPAKSKQKQKQPETAPAKSRHFIDSDVISEIDNDERILSEEEINDRCWRKIYEYYLHKDIIEGKLIGVEVDDENRCVSICINLQNGRFTVRIPDYLFFNEKTFKKDYMESTEEAKFMRRSQMARKMLGARISFVITVAERSKTGYVLVGDRMAAMARKRNKYFYGENGPKINVGDKVEPRVLSVGLMAAKVEIHGVETLIPARSLSGRHWVKDCRDEVAPGAKFIAVVTHLAIDKDNDTVAIEVSKKRYDNNIMLENSQSLVIGTAVLGEVVGINKEKERYVVALDCDALGVVPFARVVGLDTLSMGDAVSFIVIDNKANGIVIGKAMKLANGHI